MALANVVVTVNEPNVTVSSDNVNVTVAQTTTNVTVGNATIVSNADVRAAISVTDTGGFGNLTYAEANGVFTFSGTSAADINNTILTTPASVRPAISNASPITYNVSTGVIGLEQSLDDITLKKYQETIVDSGTVSGVVALNIANGTVRKMEIGADITGFTFSNLSAGGSATLIITQDGGGGNSLDTTTTPSNWTAWEFAGGLSTLDENGGNWTIINIFYNGSKYFASVITQAATQIPNSELANSSLIVNGTTISLGGSGNIANFGALTTSALPEGSNEYFTNTRFDSRFNTQLATKSTDNLTEGSSNLYYTSARANADSVAHIATVPLTVGGNLAVTGNLEITGNINYREVTDLLVRDQTITMNFGNATAQDAQIIVDRTGTGGGPNTDVKWNETTNRWTFTNDGSTYYNLHTTADSLTATNITATGNIDATGAITGVTTNVQANQFYGNTTWNGYNGANADTIGIGVGATSLYDDPQIPNGTKVVISGGTGNISSVAGTYYLRKETAAGLTSGSYYNLYTDPALTTPSQLGGSTTDSANTGATVNIPAVQTTTTGKWYTLGGFDTPGDVNVRGNIAGTGPYGVSVFGNITSTGSNISGANLVTAGGVSSATVTATGNITTTANISGGYFIGNGSLLTNLPAQTQSLNSGNIYLGSSTNVATNRSLDTLGQVIVTSNTFGAKNQTAALTVLYGSAGTGGGQDYLQFDSYSRPQFPAGTRVELTGGVGGNPFTNGALTDNNVFYVSDASGGTYGLFTDPALSNASVSGSGDISASDSPTVNYSAFSVSPSGVTFAHNFKGDTLTLGDSFRDDSVLTLHGEATFNTANNSQSALTLAMRGANSVEGPLLTLYKDNTNAATAGDTQGHILFRGDNGSGGQVNFARIESKVGTPSSGSEDGEINFKVMKAGSETSIFSVTDQGIETVSTANVVVGNNAEVKDRLHAKQVTQVTSGEFYGGGNDVGFGLQTAIGFGTPYDTPYIPDGTKFVFSGGSGNAATALAGSTAYVKSAAGVSAGGYYILYADEALTTAITVGGSTTGGTIDCTFSSFTTTNEGGIWSYGNIEARGTIFTKDGISSNGNVEVAGGRFYKGDGSLLSNLPTGGNSFGTALVSGQTNVQATQSNASIEFVAGTNITLTTAANAITINSTASGGGTYGNANVQLWLNDGSNAGNITTAGNLNVNGSSGSTTATIQAYFGSANTGSKDQVQPAVDPSWTNSTAITFSGTSNGDLTFLNGNTYYTKSVGGGYYEFYTDSGLTSAVISGLGGEAPTGLIATYTGTVPIAAQIGGTLTNTGTVSLATDGGNTNVGGNFVMAAGKTLFTAGISIIGGGTLNLASVRATDFKANDPLGIQEYANSAIGSVSPFKGSIAYVNGDRHGVRGAPCYYDGSAWRYFSDDATVTT